VSIRSTAAVHLNVDTDSGRIKVTRDLSEAVTPQVGIRHQQALTL
jgi:hypothetical protein